VPGGTAVELTKLIPRTAVIRIAAKPQVRSRYRVFAKVFMVVSLWVYIGRSVCLGGLRAGPVAFLGVVL
jgi:hypothetical protein